MKPTHVLAASLSLLAQLAGPIQAADFVKADGTRFIAGGAEFKALGGTLYPFIGNKDYFTRVASQAEAAGLKVLRSVNMLQGVEGKVYPYMSEEVWAKMDWLIKTCADHHIRVLIDLSTMNEWFKANHLDAYDPGNYPQWDALVDFATSRINTYTGLRYNQDPAIFAWAISGEPLPFGFKGSKDESRDVNVIEALQFHVADRLKSKDPAHLVSTGGLLHMGVAPKDASGREYWRSLWAHPSIDFASLHIYPQDAAKDKGEWNNLARYKKDADALGKPFVLEEFGMDRTSHSAAEVEGYFSYAYDQCRANAVPVVIFWNWGPRNFFDVFPHVTGLAKIVREASRDWGHSGRFKSYREPQIGGRILYDFEEGPQGFEALSSSDNRGGVAGTSPMDSGRGRASLRLGLDFTDTHAAYASFVARPKQAIDFGPASKLACDIYAPAAMSTGEFSIRFVLGDGAKHALYYQSIGGMANNWLSPGVWNTVYADLSKQGGDWVDAWHEAVRPDFSNISEIRIEVHHRADSPVYVGEILADRLRLADKP